MLASYTVKIKGESSGNEILNPFTIEVVAMNYLSEDKDSLEIFSCTKNGKGDLCLNDAIPSPSKYVLPTMSASKNADLTATFEASLTTAYGSSWVKN